MDSPTFTRRGFLFALGAVAIAAPPLAKMIEAALPKLPLYEPARKLGLKLVRTHGSGLFRDGLLVYRDGFDPGYWQGAIAVGRYLEHETVAQGLVALNTVELIRRPGRPPIERMPLAMHVYEFERYLGEIRSLLTAEQVAFMNRRRPGDLRT